MAAETKNLCEQCAALCCRYFVLEIDTPETRRQYDDVRWYLLHENSFVFIEKKKWYLGIYARCKQLQPDNRCGIYHKRPKICRSYSTDNCDYHGGEYNWEILFSSAEQLERYAQEQLKSSRPRAKKRKAPKKKTGKEHTTRHARRRGRPATATAAALAARARQGGNGTAGNGNGQAGTGSNGRGVSLPILRGR